MKKVQIIVGVFLLLVIGVGIYNPEIRINVDQQMINVQIEKTLAQRNEYHVKSLKSYVKMNSLYLNLKEDLAVIDFNMDGKRENGSKISLDATAHSGLYYEDGKIYLDEPWVDSVHNYSFELQGKEKVAYDTIKKGKDFLDKKGFLDKVSFGGKKLDAEAIKKKSQETISKLFENVPVYDVNSNKDIKGFLIQQATGDILIEDQKIVAVLKPFGLLLKFLVIGIMAIGMTIGFIRNPDAFGDLFSFS